MKLSLPTSRCGSLTLAVAVLVVLAARSALAGSGAVMTYPLGNIKAVNGLQMTISSHWIEGNGYRPVEFEFICLPAATADRRVTVNFAPNGWGPLGRAQRVQFDVEIPEGSSRVSKTISVPQKELWYQWEVSVYEEGRRLKELSATTGIPRRAQSWGWTEAYPTMLFIDSDAPTPNKQGVIVNQIQAQGSGAKATNKLPNIRRLARFFAPHNNYQQQLMEAAGSSVPTDNDILVMLQNLSTVALVPPSDLPSAWIDYTCADIMLISLEDLRLTIQQQPNAWAAMRKYITTGGNLVVYGVGAKFENLAQLEQLMAIPTVDEQEKQNQRFAGWKDPSPSRFGMRMTNILPTEEYVTTYQGGATVTRAFRTQVDRTRPTKNKNKIPEAMFVTRKLGLGQIVAIGPEDPFLEDQEHWNWLFAHLGQDRWQWYRRNGVSGIRANDDFWDFLIPNVGAAPVKTFLAIITGFMIIIGPVNYWFLRKWKRLYLLLVTVPAGAGLIAFCLFAYALLIDGLGTRARIRSFTEIDADTNTAVSWSRQSYYASLAPSGGLVFPSDSAVYAIDYSPDGAGRRRVIRWGSQQNLTVGYVGARSISQLMVVNAASTNEKIAINQQGSEITAVNQLQTPVTHLVVRDEDQFYWAEQIAPNQSAKLKSLPREEVLDRLGKLRSSNRPSRPDGFVSPRRSRRYYYYSSSDDQFAAPSVQTSILERQISSLSLLPPDEKRVYIAITSDSPSMVPMGVSDAEQIAGFHVIRGTW